LTTYESLKLLRKELLGHAWAYVALDEGQKIRNPDAEVGRGGREGGREGRREGRREGGREGGREWWCVRVDCCQKL
jgi:hypothetical protein